jgi:DNA primase
LKKSLESQTLEAEKSLDLALLYLQARGIDQELGRNFRLGVVSDSSSKYCGRLSIPSLLPDGSVYNLRYRSLDQSEPKYLGLPGLESRLFNVRAIHQADDEIHVTEGELDAIVLSGLGLRAVGVLGSDNWKRHHPRMLAGFVRVFAWGDGDSAGQKLNAKIRESLTNTVVTASLGSGQDVTDLYLQGGEVAIRKAIGLDDE